MQPSRRPFILSVFAPSQWPYREAVSRCVALCIVGGFIILRIVQFDQFPQTWSSAARFYGSVGSASGPVYSQAAIATLWGIKLAVWLIETGIFLGYLASYLSRAKAVSIADGFMETAFPIIVAGIPVLISMTPYTLPRWAPLTSPKHMYYYLVIMSLIVLGGLINLVGLLTLRRAFTIMTEARTLITRGIFHWVRHPLYSGHFIMFFGSLLMRFHWYTVVMYILFAAGQVIRAKREEHKLEGVFPEYAAYKDRTGMFFPRTISPRTVK
jgi:protein-S-isoprenylcysteine O-methyltransferase Ste14